MNKLKAFLVSIIISLAVVGIVFAWTNPTGNPTADGGALYYLNGNVGIGTTDPGTSKLKVTGIIESTSGGIKFPDGTIQTTAGIGSSLIPRWSVKVASTNNYTLPSQFTSPIATFSLPSFGPVFVQYDSGDRWGYNNSVLFEMTVNSNGSQTKTLKLFAVDNYVYVYLRGTLIYSYVGAATFDDAPVSVTFNLTNGNNLIQVVFADQGGVWYLSLVGDLIDNSNVFFVAP